MCEHDLSVRYVKLKEGLRMNCYSCGCKCIPVREYDGMFPSDVRCPECGRIFDGDGELIEDQGGNERCIAQDAEN